MITDAEFKALKEGHRVAFKNQDNRSGIGQIAKKGTNVVELWNVEFDPPEKDSNRWYVARSKLMPSPEIYDRRGHLGTLATANYYAALTELKPPRQRKRKTP